MRRCQVTGAACPRYVLLLLVLFFIPGVVMTVAYGLISRELYRGIRFELDVKREVAGEGMGRGRVPTPGGEGGLSPHPCSPQWWVPQGHPPFLETL